MPKPILDNNFSKPFLLICEGKGDKNFFIRLFEHHKIGDQFEIKSVNEGADGRPAGRDAMGEYIRSLNGNEDYKQNVRALLIVSDNDDSQDQSFKAVQEQIRIAGLPIPDKAQEITFKKGEKATAILMLPIGSEGNLETLCLPVAYKQWGLEDEVDAWVASTPAREWSIGKQGKVKIQALIAVQNKKKPETGFAVHWQNKKEELRISVADEAFDEIVRFIRDFPDQFEE